MLNQNMNNTIAPTALSVLRKDEDLMKLCVRELSSDIRTWVAIRDLHRVHGNYSVVIDIIWIIKGKGRWDAGNMIKYGARDVLVFLSALVHQRGAPDVVAGVLPLQQ